MNKGVVALLVAQFLSAFADNAILFVAIAMVMQADGLGDWYVPALQSVFLVAFVVLAPWVGRLADRRSKPIVLLIGNAIKALATLMILLAVEPLIAYALVGVGAAIYGPAKYGILPELVGSQGLVKANAWIEGSTILAIVTGSVVGARIADASIDLGLMVVIASYVLSIMVTFAIPRVPPRGSEAGPATRQFWQKMRGFFRTSRARFAMLGASLFWAAAAVLRVLIVAWAPAVLLLDNAGDIAELTLFLAIGIVIGAGGVPRLIPIERLRRARLAAYAMGGLIICLSLVHGLWPARGVLLAIGISGGMFVVPINAALQEIGHQSIGSGNAVAIQNFFENFAMLMAVGFYTYATSLGAGSIGSIVVLGIAVLIATLIIAWRLPKEPILEGQDKP